ncbi:MAG TPA: hypothetical protein VGP28_02595 [Methylocella sp.]|nr:hypothetical protein [Methylocella sp.]
MNDCHRIGRPRRTKLLAKTAWILAACWINRRMVDRRRVEGDLIPHQITIKSVDRDARRLLESEIDCFVSRRNGKQTFQFLGVFARKRRFRGSRRACQGEDGR